MLNGLPVPSLQRLRRACGVSDLTMPCKEPNMVDLLDANQCLSQTKMDNKDEQDLSPPSSEAAASTCAFSDSASWGESRDQSSPSSLAHHAAQEFSDQESVSADQDKSPDETSKLCTLPDGVWNKRGCEDLVELSGTDKGKRGEQSDRFIAKKDDAGVALAASETVGVDAATARCRTVPEGRRETHIPADDAAILEKGADDFEKSKDTQAAVRTTRSATMFSIRVEASENRDVRETVQGSSHVETTQETKARDSGGETHSLPNRQSAEEAERDAWGGNVAEGKSDVPVHRAEGKESTERQLAETDPMKEGDPTEEVKSDPSKTSESEIRDREPRPSEIGCAVSAGAELPAAMKQDDSTQEGEVQSPQCQPHAGKENRKPARPRLVLRRTGGEDTPTSIQEESKDNTPVAASSPGSRLVRTPPIDEDVFVSVVTAESSAAVPSTEQSVSLPVPASRCNQNSRDNENRLECGLESPASGVFEGREGSGVSPADAAAVDPQPEASCSLTVSGSGAKRQFSQCTSSPEIMSPSNSKPGVASPANSLLAGTPGCRSEVSAGEKLRDEVNLTCCGTVRLCCCAIPPRTCACSLNAAKSIPPPNNREWRTSGCFGEAVVCGCERGSARGYAEVLNEKGVTIDDECLRLSGMSCATPWRGDSRLDRCGQSACSGCWRVATADVVRSASGDNGSSTFVRGAAERCCAGGFPGNFAGAGRSHGGCMSSACTFVERADPVHARRLQASRAAVCEHLAGACPVACRTKHCSPHVQLFSGGCPFLLGPQETAAAAVAIADACEDTFQSLGWISEKQGSKQAKAESKSELKSRDAFLQPNEDEPLHRTTDTLQHGSGDEESEETGKVVASTKKNGSLLSETLEAVARSRGLWSQMVLESLLERLREANGAGEISVTPTSEKRAAADRVVGPSRLSTMDSPVGNANELSSMQCHERLGKVVRQTGAPKEVGGTEAWCTPLSACWPACKKSVKAGLEATDNTHGFARGSERRSSSCGDVVKAVLQEQPGRVKTLTAVSRSLTGAEARFGGALGTGASRPELFSRSGVARRRTDEVGRSGALQTEKLKGATSDSPRQLPPVQSWGQGAPIRTLAEARIASLNVRCSRSAAGATASPCPPSRTVVRRQGQLETTPGLAKAAVAVKTREPGIQAGHDSNRRVDKDGRASGSAVLLGSGTCRAASAAPNARNAGPRRARDTPRRDKQDCGRRSLVPCSHGRGSGHNGHAPSAPDATQHQLDALHAAAAAVLRSRLEGHKRDQTAGRSSRHALRAVPSERGGTNLPAPAVSSEGCDAENDSPAGLRNCAQVGSEGPCGRRFEGNRETLSSSQGSSAKAKGTCRSPATNGSSPCDAKEDSRSRSDCMQASESYGSWRQRHAQAEAGEGLPREKAGEGKAFSAAGETEKSVPRLPVEAATLAKEFARKARLGEPRGSQTFADSQVGMGVDPIECLIAGVLPLNEYAGLTAERAAEHVLHACTGNPVPRVRRSVSISVLGEKATAVKRGVSETFAFGGSWQESKGNAADDQEEQVRKRRKLQFLLGIPCGLEDIEEALQWSGEAQNRLASAAAPVSASSRDVLNPEPSRERDQTRGVLVQASEGPAGREEGFRKTEPRTEQQPGEEMASEVKDRSLSRPSSIQESRVCHEEASSLLAVSSDSRRTLPAELCTERFQVGRYEGEGRCGVFDRAGTAGTSAEVEATAMQGGVEPHEDGDLSTGVKGEDLKAEEDEVRSPRLSRNMSLLREAKGQTSVLVSDTCAAESLGSSEHKGKLEEDSSEGEEKAGSGPAWANGSVLSRVGTLSMGTLSCLRRFSSRSTVCTAGSFSRASSTTTSAYDLSPVASQILSGWSGSISCPEKGGECGDGGHGTLGISPVPVSPAPGLRSETFPESGETSDDRESGSARPALEIDLSGSKGLNAEARLGDGADGNFEEAEEAGEKTCGSEDSRTTAACVELMIEMFQAVGEEAAVAAAASLLERTEKDDLESQWEDLDGQGEASSPWKQGSPGESLTPAQQNVSVRM